MANADQVYGTNGPSVDTGAHQRLYSISIIQSGFNSTASSTASGGVTPATYNDFGTKPSSTNNSFLLSSSILVSKAEYFFPAVLLNLN